MPSPEVPTAAATAAAADDAAATATTGADPAGTPLQRVVYVSRSAPGHGPEMLTNLLKGARRNNQAAGITGTLLCCDGHFLQYFEGPRAAVRDLLSMLGIDQRHERMEVLLDEPAGERLCDGWDMHCLAVGAEGWRQLAAADWPRAQPPAPGARPGLEVLAELTHAPVAPVDRARAFGGVVAGRRATDISVADPPPEQLAASRNFAAVTALAVVLALVVLYQWLA